MSSPDDLSAGYAITEDLVLARPLGEGAIGSVWEATSKAHGGRVAVKMLHQPFQGENHPARIRFEREAQSIQDLRSPHIVRVLEFGVTVKNLPYLVMEHISGETLGEFLAREVRVAPSMASRMVQQVGAALDAAHARGVVHRDIKPDNIIMVDSAELELKVVDFGMAKRTRRSDGDLTRPGVAVGTPEYMSPEQVLGTDEVDHRSDVWALGVLAYRLLTGTVPFQHGQLHGLVMSVCRDPHLPVTSRGGPPALDPWFDRVLAKRCADRFRTARAAVAALHRIVSSLDAELRDSKLVLTALAPVSRSEIEAKNAADSATLIHKNILPDLSPRPQEGTLEQTMLSRDVAGENRATAHDLRVAVRTADDDDSVLASLAVLSANPTSRDSPSPQVPAKPGHDQSQTVVSPGFLALDEATEPPATRPSPNIRLPLPSTPPITAPKKVPAAADWDAPTALVRSPVAKPFGDALGMTIPIDEASVDRTGETGHFAETGLFAETGALGQRPIMPAPALGSASPPTAPPLPAATSPAPPVGSPPTSVEPKPRGRVGNWLFLVLFIALAAAAYWFRFGLSLPYL